MTMFPMSVAVMFAPSVFCICIVNAVLMVFFMSTRAMMIVVYMSYPHMFIIVFISVLIVVSVALFVRTLV